MVEWRLLSLGAEKHNKRIKLDNTLLIIDEVQNIVSEHGTFYKTIYNSIKKAPDNNRIILLSGTPIFDKPSEIALIAFRPRSGDCSISPKLEPKHWKSITATSF